VSAPPIPVESFLVFDTLNSYIDRPDDRFTEKGGTHAQISRPGGTLHPLFPAIASASIVSHLIFYSALVILNVWAVRSATVRRPRPSRGSEETVSMIDVAKFDDRRFGVRPRPDPIERADLNRLSLDSHLGDDTTVISRSPRPARTTPVDKPEPGSGGRRPATTSAAQSRSGRSDTPPAMRPPQTNPPVQSQDSGQVPARPPQPAPEPPPVPAPPRPAPKPVAPREPVNRAGGEGQPKTSELGLRSAQSQYVAIVRDRIWKVNEQIMPRGWIRDMLAERVSADFTILLGRGGQLISSRLVRSCGYTTLDQKAREAIQLAAPFHGYPQEAGENLEFTVTVFYTPGR
jgi:TonB family protein